MPRRPALPNGCLLGTIIVAVAVASLGLWAYQRHAARALMPSPEPDTGAVWLGDFESSSDLGRGWRSRGVEADLTAEHATHGHLAVRLRFPGTRAPAFLLELRASDWSGYGSLEFDLTSAESRPQRLLVRLADEDGRAYQEEVHLRGGASEHVALELSLARLYLDPRRVTELSFFRWRPPEGATFYLDGVVLRPGPRSASGPTTPSPVPTTRRLLPSDHWQLGWASSLEKLSPDPTNLESLEQGPVSLALARREKEAAQIVLVGTRDHAVRISLSTGALRALDGRGAIPPECVETRRVAWVRTRKPSYPVVRVGDWPDPLPLGSEVEVPPGELRAFWITVRAPEDQPAGTYAGTLTLAGSDGRTERIEIVVRVRGFSLPRVPSLKTAFELDRTLLAQGYRQFVPGGAAWNGRLAELERLYVLDMLDHRLSPILNADPTSPGFAEELAPYLDKGLTSFGVGAHGGNYSNEWPQGGPALAALMDWYRRAALALRAQDLLDHAYVYAWDEPPPEHPRLVQILGALHAAAPDLRRLVAVDEAPDPARHARWLHDADILCLRITAWDDDLARAYRAQGKELWLYVATPSPPRPALVVDYPAMAHRILPWMCRKLGASGLLFWSVNFWRVDPWKDTNDFVDDQNLSGTLYYPGAQGPVSSIRLEVLRDGVEDLDYLSLLEQLATRARARGVGDGALLDRAQALAAVPPELVRSPREYSRDPAALLARREEVAAMIERLQGLLAPARHTGSSIP